MKSSEYFSAMGVASYMELEAAVVAVPEGRAEVWGFRSGERGTHTSRTMMLQDLAILLHDVPVATSRQSYADAVEINNCLGKKTSATRKISLQRLTELYALDPRVVLFRVFRNLYRRDESSLPLLGLLLALARDPLLRATAAAVLQTPYGHEFSRQPMKEALSRVAHHRLNEETLDKTVRYASSSWTQSGHLRGRGRKTRMRVRATAATVTYALFLGSSVGHRGRQLFDSPWCAVLDADANELIELSVVAKRLGLLGLKQSGSMIDISFPAIPADTTNT